MQVAESALADGEMRGGDRLALALMRQALRRLSIVGHSTDRQHLVQVAESALADGEVRGGDRLALMRRTLRLGKPPRRWKQPSWICQLPCEPREVGFRHTLLHHAVPLPHTRQQEIACLVVPGPLQTP